MKQQPAIISFLFLSLLLLQYAHAQQTVLDGVYLKADQEQINEIEKIKQDINDHLTSYVKTIKAVDSSGSRHVYTDGKETKLVTVVYNDNEVKRNVSWYFNREQLVYAETIWTNTSDGELFINEKYYLNNGHLFAWIQNGTPMQKGSDAFNREAEQLAAYALKLKTEQQ